MRVRFTAEALLAVREKRPWWQEHRKEAPHMFAEELCVIVAKLRDGTAAERQKYAARGGHIIWRILMPRTRNHVYYRVNASVGKWKCGSYGMRSMVRCIAARIIDQSARITPTRHELPGLEETYVPSKRNAFARVQRIVAPAHDREERE